MMPSPQELFKMALNVQDPSIVKQNGIFKGHEFKDSEGVLH